MTLKQYLESQKKVEIARLESYDKSSASSAMVTNTLIDATRAAIKEIDKQIHELKG